MEAALPSTNDKIERNEIIYCQENVVAALLQILSRAKNMVDICADFRAPSVSIKVEQYNKALLDLKSRGVRFRQITEITKDNLSFSKQLMRIAEVRHLDGVKGNFMTSEKEYLAPVVLFQKGKVTSQIIYSNVIEVVEQHKYLFETLWTKAISAQQKIQEIEEGIKPDVIEIIRDPIEIQNIFINLIESQPLELKKEQFNLNDAITNAMNEIMINIDFLRKSQRNAIKLLYHQPQDIFIQADKERITQVILNLLSNAVKSIDEGTITVSLEKKEDNDHVVISLKDTGTGIDPEILPRLFTRFATKSFAGVYLQKYYRGSWRQDRS